MDEDPHTRPHIWVSYTSYMGSRDTSPDPARADSSQLPVTCVRDTLLTQNARFFSVQLPPVLLRDPVKAEQRMREQLSGRVQQPKTAHKGAALWLTVARLLAVNERHLSDSVTVPCTRTRDAR